MIVEGKLIEPTSSHNLQLRIGIDPKQLLLQESHNRQKGGVDLIFAQRDSVGKILSAEKQHLDLKLQQAQYEFLAKAGMVLEYHMAIKPQATEIRVVVSKFRRQSEQKGEKRLAVFCHNLLLFSGLRRLRQDLANLAPRLQSRCSPS
jgi:hypothetical protein